MPGTTDHAGKYLPSPEPGEALILSRLEKRLPTLLSVIAGMVDLTSFLTLGNIFAAHITGNLVVIAAVLVRGGPSHLAQVLAIPVFMLAVAIIWKIAKSSGRRGSQLARLLLKIQFFLLVCLLIFSVIAKPSANPHGLMSGIAVMIAISAMASQYALMRLAIPGAISTAVMTGNLTNAVLSLLDRTSVQPLMEGGTEKSKHAIQLIGGFFVGCIVAAAAVSLLGDWAWLFPAVLAGVALAFGRPTAISF